jgi:hypothetical protein
MANATTIPQMNGSAAKAAPINTAAPTTKAIPPKMNTTQETSLREMIGGRFTPRSSTLTPPVFLPLRNPYSRADANGVLTSAARNGDTGSHDRSADEAVNLGNIGLAAMRRYGTDSG